MHAETLTKPSYMISVTKDNYLQTNESISVFKRLRYYNISYNDVYPSFNSEFYDLIDNNDEDGSNSDTNYDEDHEDIDSVDDDSNANISDVDSESDSD